MQLFKKKEGTYGISNVKIKLSFHTRQNNNRKSINMCTVVESENTFICSEDLTVIIYGCRILIAAQQRAPSKFISTEFTTESEREKYENNTK